MGVACPSPVAGHCRGMVDGVAPSLSCRSDAPRPCRAEVARRSYLVLCVVGLQYSLRQDMAGDVLVIVRWRRREPWLYRCRGRAIVGGSADMDPQAAEPLKQTAEALEGIIGPGYWFRGHSIPDVAPHAALFSEQELAAQWGMGVNHVHSGGHSGGQPLPSPASRPVGHSAVLCRACGRCQWQ